MIYAFVANQRAFRSPSGFGYVVIIWLLHTLIDLYSLVIFVSVILSWIQVDRSHPAVRFIDRLTEPVLDPVRRVLPPMAGLDLSPMVVLVGLRLLSRLL